MLTIKEAAKLSGLTYAQIRWAIVTGLLQAQKRQVGPMAYYAIAELDLAAYTEARKASPDLYPPGPRRRHKKRKRLTRKQPKE